jgi:hypothetical protein
LRSQREINIARKDTVTQYYFYGDNPSISGSYDEHLVYYYDEELKDTIEDLYSVTHSETVFHKDTIYSSYRWLGFNVVDFSDTSNLPKAYLGNDEEQIQKEFFNRKNLTTISRKNFYINGMPGYEYLLEVYNNRMVLVEEGHNDSNGNYIQDRYKKQNEIEKIKELPNKIIVQTTITDFWFIELTD